MGPEFKNFVLGMENIRSTAIYPPKTSVDTVEAPLDQEAEVIRVFSWGKGTTEKGQLWRNYRRWVGPQRELHTVKSC